MGVSKRIRFEVFKRDDFTCTYCGRKVPDVTLEVDHIVPQVEGGGGEIENLTTSCMDCNRGKAGIPLENVAAVQDLAERTDLLREREEQIRAYNEVKAAERERLENAFDIAWNHWFARYEAETLPRWYTPNEGVVRRYLRDLPLAEVLDAIDITYVRYPSVRADAPRYLGGVLRRKLAAAQDRLRTCSICGETITLSPEERAAERPEDTWSHTACLEKGSG